MMIYKCPNCNGALAFNPLTEQLECSYCGNGYSIQQLEDDSLDIGRKKSQKCEPDKEQSKESETMECQIYTCTSCGGELVANDAEVSTYCAYCGQPTIVFNRISNELKPDYIIPFKITKEQAVEGIRERLKKGFFVPDKVKNFEVERVRGIYVPYWLYDIYYYDKQIVTVITSKGDLVWPYYLYEAEAEYNKVLLDASKQLNDETSMKLEPYDLRLLKEFKTAYMSGFYADRADQRGDEHMRRAALRVKPMFDEETREKVSTSVGKPFGQILRYVPRYQIKDEKYALLPAWFLTFSYRKKRYTMLVNGQTGKVVGAVPIDKKKVIALVVFITLVSSGAFYFVWYFIFTGIKMYGPPFWIFLIAMLGIIWNFYKIGIRSIIRYKKNISLTRSKQTEQYVRERQDKT